ncbi:MAG: anaerobic ribonucleoside-triphosphate reductase activating protein [Candidatus Hydrogenedentes bacterium]|nr:anaerobic ribonucleoside-triphosphate reductase activating protein [Candidatus Hydrogenedentota bacterium]
MNIAGVEKCSFVDYPGRLAAVFFVPGCNWNCFYCHNQTLLRNEGLRPRVSREEAFNLLNARRGLLDGVVVTGGEPTLQSGLREFIAAVRDLDYLVKLDTNGSRPQVLGALLAEGLLDYVAMDLKAPMPKYEAVCGAPVDHRHINESIDLIMSSDVEYEFRTTVVPQLTHADVVAIARRIQGARRYVLQQYRNPALYSPDEKNHDPRLDAPPHESAWPAHVLAEIDRHVVECETRGFQRSLEATSAA